MKSFKKFTLWCGAVATLASPLLVVIACGKEKTEKTEIEKQLLNVRNIQDSEYSAQGIKEAIKNLTPGNPFNPDTLKITKDALDPGWEVKYYLTSLPSIYQAGNLNIKAEITHQDDLATTLSKTVVVRPNANDDLAPTLNHPQQIQNNDIYWTKDEGDMTIAPDPTLSVATIEQAFLASDNSGEIIKSTFTWSLITSDKPETPWLGTNFAKEGFYRLLVSAQDSNNNTKSLELDVIVTNLKNELDQVPNVLTSTKNKDELKKALISKNLGDYVDQDTLGITINQNLEYDYDWSLKTKLENNQVTLELRIEALKSDQIIKGLNKEIKLMVGYDFTSIIQELENMSKTSSLPINDLKSLDSSAKFSDFGVSWPQFPSEIKAEIKIIDNDVLNSGRLTTEIILTTGHSQIAEQVIIKANQPPTFTLNTRSQIGGSEKGAEAKIINQKSGSLTLPFNLQFTKKEIASLVTVNDDLDIINDPEIIWTLDGDVITGELDNRPLKDTTYNLKIIATDSLQQKASYNLAVIIEKDKQRPNNPQWQQEAAFGTQIAFQFDSQNHDFGQVIINQNNFANLPEPSAIDQIVQQAIKEVAAPNQVKYRWTTSPYTKAEGIYQLELWVENTKGFSSSSKLSLTINIDVTSPTLIAKKDASLGDNILDLKNHKLFVNEAALVTSENLKALFVATDKNVGDLNQAIAVDLTNFDATKENQEQVIVISVDDQNGNQATYELKIEIDTTKPILKWVDNPAINSEIPIIETLDFDHPEKAQYIFYKIINNEVKVSSEVRLDEMEEQLSELIISNTSYYFDYSGYDYQQGGIIKIITTSEAHNESVIELKVTIVDKEINYRIPEAFAFGYEDHNYKIENGKIIFPNKLKQLIEEAEAEEGKEEGDLAPLKELLTIVKNWSASLKNALNLEPKHYLYTSIGLTWAISSKKVVYCLEVIISDEYGNDQLIEIPIEFN